MATDQLLSEKKTVAILIDGDNAQPSLIREMLAETSKYGRVTVRKIYGDWTSPQMNGWKDALQDGAIQPVQQFRNTIGKNATDSMLIIDAMDILHAEVVNGFCLVSSDSDFTRLATRIREQGVFVMGMGQRKTPKSFTNACDVFVFTENLALEASKAGEKVDATGAPAKTLPATKALVIIRKAFGLCVQDNGWANLGALGSSLRQLDSSFDHRSYGCSTLKTLIIKLSHSIELGEEKKANGSAVAVVKVK